jgi:hypothetical protein
MNEPGIFKGCHDVHGPISASTKDAIIAYLGRPRVEAWEIIRHSAVVPGTTLGDAWDRCEPGHEARIPDATELVRSIRRAVVRNRGSRA